MIASHLSNYVVPRAGECNHSILMKYLKYLLRLFSVLNSRMNQNTAKCRKVNKKRAMASLFRLLHNHIETATTHTQVEVCHYNNTGTLLIHIYFSVKVQNTKQC